MSSQGLSDIDGTLLPELQSQLTCPGMPGTQNSNTAQGKTMAYPKVGLGVCSGFLVQELASLSVPVPAPPAGTGDTSTMQLRHDRDRHFHHAAQT